MKGKTLESLIAECQFEPRYSGEESRRVWAEIQKSKDRTLYDFGCALQDTESRFLSVLNAHVETAVRRIARRKRSAR